MKIRNLVWCLLLPVLITGCAAPSGQATPDTAAPTQIATATALFLQRHRRFCLHRLILSPLPHPAHPRTRFPLELPESIKQNCLEILPDLPMDKTYNGKIVFFMTSAIFLQHIARDLIIMRYHFTTSNTRQMES